MLCFFTSVIPSNKKGRISATSHSGSGLAGRLVSTTSRTQPFQPDR